MENWDLNDISLYRAYSQILFISSANQISSFESFGERKLYKLDKNLSILQYDVIFLSPDFLRKLRGFSKGFAYVGSVAKGNIG